MICDRPMAVSDALIIILLLGILCSLLPLHNYLHLYREILSLLYSKFMTSFNLVNFPVNRMSCIVGYRSGSHSTVQACLPCPLWEP